MKLFCFGVALLLLAIFHRSIGLTSVFWDFPILGAGAIFLGRVFNRVLP